MQVGCGTGERERDTAYVSTIGPYSNLLMQLYTDVAD